MKRILVVFLGLGLVAGSVSTAEAKRKPARVERTVRGSYNAYPAPVTGCNAPLGSFSCLIVQTRRTEKFFTAKVTDTHGRPVFVEVYYNRMPLATFCGETTRPIAFAGGDQLHFYIGLNSLYPTTHCPAHRVKTTGTISVTLSNLR